MIPRPTHSLPVACASNPFHRVYVHAWVIARQFGTSKADVHATRKEMIAKGVKPVCSGKRNRTPLSSSMKHERARGLVVMENGVLVKSSTIEGRNTEPKKSYRQIRTNKVNIRRIKEAHQSLKYWKRETRPDSLSFWCCIWLVERIARVFWNHRRAK